MEPIVVAEHLAKLSAAEFAGFEPFPQPGDDHDQLYSTLLYEDGPTLSCDAANWARQTKDARLALTERFKSQSADARTVAKRNNVRKVNTFADALAAEGALQSFVFSFLSSEDKRTMVVSDKKTLFRSVMTNPYLRHFFHAWLFYTISLTRLWANQRLNRDPVTGRDDLADLTLGLYVGPDDAVLTEDRLLCDAFRMIDPSIQIVAAADL